MWTPSNQIYTKYELVPKSEELRDVKIRKDTNKDNEIILFIGVVSI